jgi:GT2 family glycosyltransferase
MGLDAKASVAVIIVNHNSGALLGRCLNAIADQSLPPSRIIVVDNASADGSADAIEQSHSGVQVIHCKENFGFAKGNNLGIAATEGCEWIACLNPDAFPEPDWLERFMNGASGLPEYHFFGCKLLQANRPGNLDGTGDVYHVSGLAWRRDHGKLDAEAAGEDGEIFAPCAAAALYRRDVLIEVGGFDESFFCYFEDVDLAFRLRLKGYRCYYVSGARVRHVGSAITGRRSDFSVYHGHRNLVWTYFKNMPASLLWLYLPLHLVLNLSSLLVYSLAGRAGVIFRAKRDAVKGLHLVWVARKTIQSHRRASASDLNRVMAKGLGALFKRR